MTVFPTWYTDKGSADNTDKVWASDNSTNFNITVWEIGDRNFTDKSTSDLSEGTNLFYTEDRVNWNVTVVGLWNTKADKTNVLEKDNTTSFTPTQDFHPATKKYVDDSWTNITGLVEEAWITDWDELIYYNWVNNVKIDYTDLRESILSDWHRTSTETGTLDMSDTAWNYTIAHWLAKIPKKITFIFDKWWDSFVTLVYWTNWATVNYSWILQDTSNNLSLNTGYLIRQITNNAPLEYIELNISSVNTANINIARTVNWTPSGGDDRICTIISES